MADFGADVVAQFDVGAGGALQPKTSPTVAAGRGPAGLAVSADGSSVYVANNGDGSISQYTVGAGGKLQSKIPATVAAGLTPSGIAVSPLAAQPAGR